MKRKIDHFLMTVILIFFPCTVSTCVIAAAIEFYYYLDDELASLWLSIACVLSVIILAIWLFKFVYAIVSWICGTIHDAKLARYYKEHPEKEKENTEALAKDFEDLAKVLRKINEDNVEVKEDEKE